MSIGADLDKSLKKLQAEIKAQTGVQKEDYQYLHDGSLY